MSKLSDYSKFDNLVIDSDDDDDDLPKAKNKSNSDKESSQSPAVAIAAPQQQQPQQQLPSSASAPSPSLSHPITRTNKKDPNNPERYIFSYGNQKIYEWEQSLETITILIDTPPSTRKRKAKDFIVNITSKHLQVGLKGHDSLFLNDDFFSVVDTTESCWYLEDNNILQIVLTKQRKGETWLSVLKKDQGDSILLEQELNEQLLRERFQEENPGMDFRDATFNGDAPNPRTYMGGIKYG